MSTNLERKSIYTDNAENDIWDYISDFESEHFVSHYIEKRIIHCHKVAKTGLEPISPNDTYQITLEVNNSAKQAKDFFMMSKELSLLSKPIMLHYAFEKLANILISLTYKKPKLKYTHGLSYYVNEPIKVRHDGLFRYFHACFSSDLCIFSQESQFSLDNLIDSGSLSYTKLCYNMGISNNSISLINSKSKEKVVIHELDREFIFIFALSTLARYRVNEWNEIISGKTNNSISKIRRYLNSTQLLFPNLLLNELYKKVLLFYAPARLAGVEIQDYDTPINLLD